MSHYKISLVAPIYGVERYIQKFAESVLAQTADNIQFIFVNDGTKDSSMEILERVIEDKFAHLRPHIIIVNKENQGLPLARKSGIERATGEYILCADSDDWLEVDAVEKIVKKIEQTNADIVYFDLIKEYGHKQSIKREGDYSAESKMLFIRNMFNYRAAGYTVTKCFRRSLYTDNKIFTPKLGMHEDIYLMSQIIFHAKSLVHLPEVLYHYRKDNEQAFCAQDRHKRHIASSRNLLDLYANYKANLAGSPIEEVADGIVLRAGWHSMIHECNLFEEYPWLAEAIRRARPRASYRTPILFQLIVKSYVALCK